MALALYNPKGEGYLFAAYRPMVMQVYLDYSQFAPVPAYPPVVFCDIYFNGVYYKSFSSTVYEMGPVTIFGGFTMSRPIWTFDIQNAAQEYLRSLPPALAGNTIASDPASLTYVRVAFRDSSIDANGFIQPQTPAPVQGNFSTAPVAGGGIFTTYYVATNATLQHEDNQTLFTHLQYQSVYYGSGLIYMLNFNHRRDTQYFCGINQYDHWPVHVPYRGLDGSDEPLTCTMYMYLIDKNGYPQEYYVLQPFTIPTAPMNYYIPTGIPNLRNLDWDSAPVWEDIVSYQIYLTDSNGDDFFTTTIIYTRVGVCDDGDRIHFLNALGSYDAVNFTEKDVTQNSKSTAWQKSLPLLGMQKRDYGNKRFNVRANREVKVRTAAYSEAAQEWLEELSRSPAAYIEWKGAQGQPADLIPIKISDGKVVSRKTDGRYEYQLEVTYEMANEKIVQRG